jgi:hypothetical protein
LADVADGQARLQAGVFHRLPHLPSAFGTNYSEFPNGCVRLKSAFRDNAFQVFVDCGHADLEQLRHQRLGEPEVLLLEARSRISNPASFRGLLHDSVSSGVRT